MARDRTLRCLPTIGRRWIARRRRCHNVSSLHRPTGQTSCEGRAIGLFRLSAKATADEDAVFAATEDLAAMERGWDWGAWKEMVV
eukprot:365108-Chlamydomonas_euryale.AAC.5